MYVPFRMYIPSTLPHRQSPIPFPSPVGPSPHQKLLVGRLCDGLVARVVLGTVGEEPVDDDADDWEKEDCETPEKLVDSRAVRLEDLDCGIISSRPFLLSPPSMTKSQGRAERMLAGKQYDLLKTMISRMRTIKPMIPPEVP